MCVIGMIFGQITFAAGMTHVLRLYKLPQLVTCVLIAGRGMRPFLTEVRGHLARRSYRSPNSQFQSDL